MTIPQETLSKMQTLSDDKMEIIINLVDQMKMKPIDIFDALCEDGASNPMTDSEIDNFVSEVKEERKCY